MRPPGERLPVIPFRGIAALLLVEGVPDQRDDLCDGVALQDLAAQADGGIVLSAAVQQVHQAELVKQLVRLHFREQAILCQRLGGIAALVVAVRQLFQQDRLRSLFRHHLRQGRGRFVVLPKLLERPHRAEVLGAKACRNQQRKEQ